MQKTRRLSDHSVQKRHFWTILDHLGGFGRFGEVSAGEFELDFLEILMFFMIDRLCVFLSFYNLLSHFVEHFVKSLFLEIIGSIVFVFSDII